MLCTRNLYIILKSTDDSKKGGDVETERSFVCRMKCILNTSAGFFKVNHLGPVVQNRLTLISY